LIAKLVILPIIIFWEIALITVQSAHMQIMKLIIAHIVMRVVQLVLVN
jgi:hypothetical protein